ncbi:hypothetical protein E4U41_005323 [Claviceps citrina]|nr:hypothetical protein E4U41_005323 [Claviceps citrina]
MDTLFGAASHTSWGWQIVSADPLASAGICLALLTVACAFVRISQSCVRRRKAAQTTCEKGSSGADVASLAIQPLHNFDWKAKEPVKYLPIKPVYHISMGKCKDAPSDLITIDRDYLDRITLRRRLISQKGSAVHGCLPRGHGSVSELYAYLLRDYLPVRYPTIFKPSPDGCRCENLVTGKAFSLEPPAAPTAALRVLGESVEEDMFLLHGTPEGHLCVAFVCCFPFGFDPSAKFGNLLKDIHAPVPSYDMIGASMERFFCKLQVGRSVKRLNWTIQTHDQLYSPGSHTPYETAEVDPDESVDPDRTFLRVELQTLTRLPKTQAVLFSFKTYLYSVRRIRADGSGPELADAIEGLKSGNAPGMQRYKSAVRWGKPVCEYLRSAQDE